MKKLCAIILMLMCLSSIGVAQSSIDKIAAADYNLKGEVKTFSENFYRATEDTSGVKKGVIIPKNYFSSDSLVFNENGKVIASYWFSNNQPKLRLRKIFNDEGLLIETRKYHAVYNDSTRTIYQYNNNQKPTDVLSYDFTGKQSEKFIYHYNNKGILTGYEWYDGNNRKTGLMEMKHNSNGLLTEMKKYAASGVVVSTYSYKYNTKNQMTEQNRIDEYFIEKVTLIYNERGDLVESITMSRKQNEGDKLKITVVEKYYPDSNITEKISYDSEGDIESRIIIKSDEHKNHVEEIILNGEGVQQSNKTFQYKYDGNNNWTERITRLSGKAKEIAERIIEYY